MKVSEGMLRPVKGTNVLRTMLVTIFFRIMISTSCLEQATTTAWMNCTAEFECSEQAVQGYMARYATFQILGRQPTCQDFARIHNGGPDGYDEDGTLGYWENALGRYEECRCAAGDMESTTSGDSTTESFATTKMPTFAVLPMIDLGFSECALWSDECDVNARCEDNTFSYTCICNDGYEGSGTICSDIDECTSGTHVCHVNAECVNNIGSYTCVCLAGYTGNGFDCVERK